MNSISITEEGSNKHPLGLWGANADNTRSGEPPRSIHARADSLSPDRDKACLFHG
jgi:hypothetical protein